MLIVMMLALWQSSSTPAPAVRTLSKGPASGIEEARQATARTEAEWTAMWRAHNSSGAPVPSVDFSREMVVGVFLGLRSTAGFGVEIVRASETGGSLVVEYVETRPARGAVTSQVLTAPYHLVAVPKHGGEVRFQKVEK